MSETASHKRRLWPWIVGCIVLLWAGLATPFVLSSIVFSPGALIGRTPAEVIARCGEPQFASVTGAAALADSDPPYWGMMSQATRDRLVSQPEFMFGYYRWLGDQWSVRFKDGKVVGTHHSSK